MGTTPTKNFWELDNDYALSTDRYGWTIYQKARNKKTGKRSNWKPVAYHPTAAQVFNKLLEYHLTDIPLGPDIIELIEQAYARVEHLQNNFIATMKQQGLYVMKTPIQPEHKN